MNGIDHIVHTFESLNGADYPDHFTYVPHPEEPNDIDKPVRCPPPEPCIMHVRVYILLHASLVAFVLLHYSLDSLTTTPGVQIFPFYDTRGFETKFTCSEFRVYSWSA